MIILAVFAFLHNLMRQAAVEFDDAVAVPASSGVKACDLARKHVA